jgi:ketosteroid isomerase-like protein
MLTIYWMNVARRAMLSSSRRGGSTMNMIENKQLLQNIFAELAQSNGKPFVEAMADGFRWTILGTTKWSKTYDGKEAVLNELLAALRAKFAGRATTIAHRFIAEDDLVVVEARGNNVTKAGLPYNNAYCFVFRLVGGKLVELTEYLDTELVTAVLGDPAPTPVPIDGRSG